MSWRRSLSFSLFFLSQLFLPQSSFSSRIVRGLGILFFVRQLLALFCRAKCLSLIFRVSVTNKQLIVQVLLSVYLKLSLRDIWVCMYLYAVRFTFLSPWIQGALIFGKSGRPFFGPLDIKFGSFWKIRATLKTQTKFVFRTKKESAPVSKSPTGCNLNLEKIFYLKKLRFNISTFQGNHIHRFTERPWIFRFLKYLTI